jgi:hypothetical protein
MTAYTKSTNFATKDTLTSGDPLKIVRGTEINTEFDNIATAVNSKSDTASPTFTGTVTIPSLSLSGLTASSAVATNASNALVSVTNTGTGNNVLATSPTLVTPILGTPQSGTLTNATGLPLTTGVTGVLPEANGGTGSSAGNQMFKNRIINGAMVIDQRNAGASVTPTTDGQYTLDRWSARLSLSSKFSVQQNAGSVSTLATGGFSNYLGATSLSAYSVLASDFFGVLQLIEGFNFSDLQWGTANAKTITISAWVYSSLTGTFGGALSNSAATRAYPFTYSIPVANTWTQISVTIAGDTSGTWVGATNGIGVYVCFGLGAGSTYSGTAGAWATSANRIFSATGATSVVGTNGATFYITGVQLEKGSTATSFDYRPYGTELALCQRYYFKTYAQDVIPGTASSSGAPGRFTDATQNYASIQIFFPVTMRAIPTCVVYNPATGTTSSLRGDSNNYAATVTSSGVQNATAYANNTSIGVSTSISAHLTASIEL